MTPAFRIVVDGEDRTAVIADRFLAIVVTDEDGTKSDRVEIELDNREGLIVFPEEDARIEVYLGYSGRPLSMMGIYAVDGVSGSGPVQTMRITATAADMKGDIRAPRTRPWEKKTMREIVAVMAAEADLTPVVGESIAGTSWPFLAQTAESNLHFLTRIASDLDATCKPAGGTLLVQKRGEGKTAAGDALTPPTIPAHRLVNWSWDWNGRTVYRAAEAEWTETGTGITHKVKTGSGTPLRKLRHPFATEAEASRAAEAALTAADRAALEISCLLAGFESGILGGGSVTLQGLLPTDLNGEWHVTSVSHRLDSGGLTTEFQAKKGRGQ